MKYMALIMNRTTDFSIIDGGFKHGIYGSIVDMYIRNF